MNNKQREFPVKKFFGYSAMYFRGEKKSCICFFTVFLGIFFSASSSSVTNALPLELISFKAEATSHEQASIIWSTATEKNSDYFTIERSADGINFESLTYVKGAGNSKITSNYKITDNAPLSGLSYYRLKQTDFNGISKYSNLAEVRIKADKNFIIYSNRFNEKNMFINYSDELKGKEVLVVLADILGNQAYSKVIITETNRTNVTAFDPSQKIPTGVYFIIASSNNSICKQKIIIE